MLSNQSRGYHFTMNFQIYVLFIETRDMESESSEGFLDGPWGLHTGTRKRTTRQWLKSQPAQSGVVVVFVLLKASAVRGLPWPKMVKMATAMAVFALLLWRNRADSPGPTCDADVGSLLQHTQHAKQASFFFWGRGCQPGRSAKSGTMSKSLTGRRLTSIQISSKSPRFKHQGLSKSSRFRRVGHSFQAMFAHVKFE